MLENGITVVLFDLDDTLVVEMATEMAVTVQTCEQAAQKAHVESEALFDAIHEHAQALWRARPESEFCDRIGFAYFEGLWSTFEGDAPEIKRLREWGAAYRREAWRRALRATGAQDGGLAESLADEIAQAHMEARRRRHVVFDDTVETLKDLRSDYRVGMVTNGASDIQRAKLAGSGLEPYMETVVVGGELGVGKPHPAPFEEAMNQLRATPAETAMVGNALEKDILGARNAGIRGIWLNRGGATERVNIDPDATIRNLFQLRDALA